jgi:hypothetical protein
MYCGDGRDFKSPTELPGYVDIKIISTNSLQDTGDIADVAVVACYLGEISKFQRRLIQAKEEEG